MAKKKNFIQSAIDGLREALQILRPRQAVEKVDKRSSARGQRIVTDLEKNFKDKEIAEALEISRQKYTSLKRQVREGKISNAVLNDLLEDAGTKAAANSGRPRDESGLFVSDQPVNGQKEFKIDFEIMGQDYIEKKIRWAQNVRPGGFASKQSAINWYAGVTGGKEYFKIVKGKDGRYLIYDVRTKNEKANKGKVSGAVKAQQIIDRDLLQ